MDNPQWRITLIISLILILSLFFNYAQKSYVNELKQEIADKEQVIDDHMETKAQYEATLNKAWSAADASKFMAEKFLELYVATYEYCANNTDKNKLDDHLRWKTDGVLDYHRASPELEFSK